jgi:sporulation protein YqfC
MRKRKKSPKEEEVVKKTMLEKMEGALEMPFHAIDGTPCIEMIGNREFMIESCKGIIEYSQEMIRISAGKYVIRLSGRGMLLVAMQETSLHISGVINMIEFLL